MKYCIWFLHSTFTFVLISMFIPIDFKCSFWSYWKKVRYESSIVLKRSTGLTQVCFIILARVSSQMLPLKGWSRKLYYAISTRQIKDLFWITYLKTNLVIQRILLMEENIFYWILCMVAFQTRVFYYMLLWNIV